MALDVEMVEKIIATCPIGVSLATYLVEQLNIVQKIRADLTRCHADEEAVKAQYEAAKKAIRDRQAHTRKLCQHWKTTYHTGASGNNDSYTDCDICGAEI